MRDENPNPNPFEQWFLDGQLGSWNKKMRSDFKPRSKPATETPTPTNVLYLCAGALVSVTLMLVGALVGSSTGKH